MILKRSNSTTQRGTGFKCRKCHRRPVARKGAVCAPCAKPPKSKSNNGRGHGASSRPVSGNASAVVARSAPVATADYYATRCPGFALVTTAEVLALHNPPLSPLTAQPSDWQQASAIADGFNAWFQQVQAEVCNGH